MRCNARARAKAESEKSSLGRKIECAAHIRKFGGLREPEGNYSGGQTHTIYTSFLSSYF